MQHKDVLIYTAFYEADDDRKGFLEWAENGEKKTLQGFLQSATSPQVSK